MRCMPGALPIAFWILARCAAKADSAPKRDSWQPGSGPRGCWRYLQREQPELFEPIWDWSARGARLGRAPDALAARPVSGARGRQTLDQRGGQDLVQALDDVERDAVSAPGEALGEQRELVFGASGR